MGGCVLLLLVVMAVVVLVVAALGGSVLWGFAVVVPEGGQHPVW